MLVDSIDIKSDGQVVSLALAELQIRLESARLEGMKALKVLHGYGSHGVGGEIKRNLHFMLKNMKRQKQILDFIPGELWMVGGTQRTAAIKICSELLIDSDMGLGNSGWTIILL